MASSQTNRWKLGLFVFLSALVGVAALIWLGANRMHGRKSIEIVTYVDESVQGLEVGAPVKYRGISIGSIKEMHIAPAKHLIQIDMDVYTETIRELGADPDEIVRVIEHGGDLRERLGPGARIQIVSAGITGSRFLQFDYFGEKDHPPIELGFDPPSNYVPSTPSVLKAFESGARETLDSVREATVEFTGFVADTRKILQGLEVEALSVQTRKLLETATRKLESLDVDSIERRGEATLEEAHQTLAEIRSFVVKLKADDGPFLSLLDELKTASRTAREEIVSMKLGETTEVLRGTAQGMREGIDSAILDFGSIARAFEALADDVRYDLRSLHNVLESLGSLIRGLERDPSSILFGKSPTLRPEAIGR